MNSAFSEEIRKPWRNSRRRGLSKNATRVVTILFSLGVVVALIITWGSWLEAFFPSWVLSLVSSIIAGVGSIYFYAWLLCRGK